MHCRQHRVGASLTVLGLALFALTIVDRQVAAVAMLPMSVACVAMVAYDLWRKRSDQQS